MTTEYKKLLEWNPKKGDEFENTLGQRLIVVSDTHAKLYVWPDFVPMPFDWFINDYTLISRADPEPTPEPEWLSYGLYDDDDPRKLAIDAAWPDVEVFDYSGKWSETIRTATYPALTYRPKQAEPKRMPDYPWDVLRNEIVACAIDENGGAYGYSKEPYNPNNGEWVAGGDSYPLDWLKFDRGNVPWDKSMMLRPSKGGDV